MKEELKVIFRIDKNNEVTAFLPQCMANIGHIVCYAHIGQHNEASLEYYRGLRLAKPDEYEDLLKELQGIYYEYTLVVRERLNMQDLRLGWYY